MTSSVSVVLTVGRSTSLPWWKVAPARTRATRWGAFTARHRDCAASMSLNAIASPAAREPGPLVTLLRCLTDSTRRRLAKTEAALDLVGYPGVLAVSYTHLRANET